MNIYLDLKGKKSLSKNSDFVIAQLDWAIQNILKRLDSSMSRWLRAIGCFRENDDLLWKWQFLDKLCVPNSNCP